MGATFCKKQMAADTLPQAEDELTELGDDALREWLRDAQPWDFAAKKF